MAEQIYGLIGKAMQKIGAIGKDSTATNTSGKQMYKFRGIDAVYNALNPVMSELGLFICPEVLEQTREERKTSSGGNLVYSILKVKFTMYAPDGSYVECVVIGEGMDSGDKASNKAMSIALKYACFQLFMIPTEDMVDPDAEVHDDVMPKETKKKFPNEAQKYIRAEMANMKSLYGIGSDAEMTSKFLEMRQALIDAGIIDNIPSDLQTLEQAKGMIDAMYKNFRPSGAKK